VGRPAPWAGLHVGRITTDRVVHALARHGAGRPSSARPDDARMSAVLAAVFDDRSASGEGAHLLLTRRSGQLSNHAGQVAFPGGRQDPGETPVQTALREAEEEVALDPSAVEVIGELDHLYTIVSRSYIVPVVGLLTSPPVDLQPSAAEVERIFTVSFEELLADGVFREERWGPAPVDRPVWFFELEGETLWGATAAMVRNLLCTVLGLEHDRPFD
jgi:8-oxo-dGTP pyrophosphatase MutT (NUDIX family)